MHDTARLPALSATEREQQRAVMIQMLNVTITQVNALTKEVETLRAASDAHSKHVCELSDRMTALERSWWKRVFGL